MTTQLLHGDCRAVLTTLPLASVQCVITSPPYFGLRNYGVDGQIGLEPTPAEYVAALVEVFREVRRVLRDDGTVWLNLGDSYAGSGRGPTGHNGIGNQTDRQGFDSPPVTIPAGLKPKDLIGIPWRVAFALQADGWYLRSDIIWSKPNCMPESVRDRPTRSHEYLFLLAKSEKYFYDADAIREPYNEASIGRYQYQMDGTAPTSRQPGGDIERRKREAGIREPNPAGRNRRSVWTIATAPYREAHFATFPEALVEPCVLAGSAAQACEVCGAPWERVVERTPMVVREGPGRAGLQVASCTGTRRTAVTGTMLAPPSSVTTGFRPTCRCTNAGTARSVVLDPFAGSGTTLRVAERLQRDSIGIELNPEYIELQEKRTDGVQVEMTL